MSAVNFPLTTTSLFVNTLNTNKIIYLPAASTVGAGRLFYIKDICGNAAASSIYISTTGMDRIENRFQPSTLYALMSTNYGSVLMAPDGALNWYFLQHYYKNAVSSLGSAAVAASGAFAPTSIATLVQWLDATDNTTVLTAVSGSQVANGGSAGYWGDKSGNGNYVTTNTVAPIYSTSLISSRAGLNFQNSAGMISAAFAKASSITLFLVGTVKSTRASWGTFWGHFTSGRHDADVQLRYTDGTTDINWHTYNDNGSSQLSYTLDSPVLYSCTMTGGTVMFMQQTNTSGTTSVTVTESLTWAAGSAPVWIGRSDSGECINSYISEIAYFQSVLSTADRQKMEGYLAWKYGLNTYLPSGHPYLSAAPGGFTPLSITGLALWLDGADSTTITTATGVSQWNDKSGNGYNLTQSTGASQPTQTGNYLNFQSSYYLNVPFSAVNNLSTWSIFFLINPISASNWIMVKQKDGSNTYNVISMTYNTNSNGGSQSSTSGYLYWRSYNAGSQAASANALSTSTVQIFNIIYDGTNLYIYINGTLNSTTAGSFAIQNDTSPSNYTLGCWIQSGSQNNSGVTNFKLGEFTCYSASLTTTNRQKIEGYLAWKWGIQASLPSGHPYYSSAPTA